MSSAVVVGAFVLSATTLVGCSVSHANARIAYWTKETQQHVPAGTPIADAQAFFSSHGLQLRCCMSGAEIEHAYFAVERGIGRFAWMEYSALIVVDTGPDRRVSRIRVRRVGAGL